MDIRENPLCMNCGIFSIRAGEAYACPSCGDVLLGAAGVEVIPIEEPQPNPQPPEEELF